MPATQTICLAIAFIFLAPVLGAVLWLNRVQVCVLFFRFRASMRVLYLKLARAEYRINRELEAKQNLLSRKNGELLELSKKHRELTELVTHAKAKSIKQQRRLLRKPNDEALKNQGRRPARPPKTIE